MNLYLVSRTDKWSYDDYDAFVVVAPSQERAMTLTMEQHSLGRDYTGWVQYESDLHVRYLGVSASLDEEIVLSSFNAG